jgi:hypothetical protein
MSITRRGFVLATAGATSADTIQAQAPMTEALAGQYQYPQTNEEINAGVTVLAANMNYPPLDARRYGAVGDNAGDQTSALADWLLVAEQTISSGNGRRQAYLPGGAYKCTGSLTIANDIDIRGDGMFQSKLIVDHASPATFLTISSGTQVRIKGIAIMNDLGSSFADDADEIAIDSSASSLEMEDCRISGWYHHLARQAGFYYKFDRCRFDVGNVLFSTMTQNNTTFNMCRFNDFVTGVECSNGNGPLSFFGCVFEKWTNEIANAVSGNTLRLTVMGCYIENYPNVKTSGSIATISKKRSYDRAYCWVSVDTLASSGNRISCSGVRRYLFANQKALFISSIGDTFDYDPGAGKSSTDFIFHSKGVERAIINSVAVPSGARNNGTFTTAYLSIGRVDFPDNSLIFDSIAGVNYPDVLIVTDSEAVKLGRQIVHLVTTGGKPVATLADGHSGQRIDFVAIAVPVASVLKPANLAGGTKITFSNVGQTASLLFTNGHWHMMGGSAVIT